MQKHFAILANPSLIVGLLMLPMAWHVFGFYESEPLFIRALLALSFEIIALFLFGLLVRKDSHKPTVWAALGVLIAFQAYVNVHQLWNPAARFKSLAGGAIFPVLFAFSVYLITRQDERERQAEIKRQKRQEAAPEPASIAEPTAPAPLSDRKFSRLEIRAAALNGTPLSNFTNASNYRSICRWYKEFQELK